MYKNLLPVLCLFLMTLLSIHSVLAQDGGIQYQYKDFRLPNIDRKALEGSLNMLNSSNNNATYFEGSSGDPFRARNSQFSNNLILDYSRFRNLEKIQALENFSFIQSFSSSENSSNASGTPVNTFNGSFLVMPRYQGEYRYYYVPNKFWGYEMDIEAEYKYNFHRNRTTQQKLTEHGLKINAFPSFMFGWGRLEPIDDIFLAKFMVDDMKDAGILDQDLTQEELFALGSTMAFVRNQRIFDFRRLRIYELTEIDRWFSASGLISNQDFKYFTVLNDNWIYAFRNTRFSGKRTTIGLTPSVQWTDNMLGDSIRQSATLGLNLRANYQIHNPINQYWQSISAISAGVSYFCLSCSQNSRKLLTPNARASQTYGWYPNSRTRVITEGFVNYSPIFQEEQELSTTTHSVSAGMNLGADYFLNFQFRVRANVGYSFVLTNRTSEASNYIDITQTYVGFQSNITLLYTFF